MAASKTPNPKYRSLDDILDALKDESNEEEVAKDKDKDKGEEEDPLDREDIEVEASSDVEEPDEEDEFEKEGLTEENKPQTPDPYTQLKSQMASGAPPTTTVPKQDQWSTYPEYPLDKAQQPSDQPPLQDRHFESNLGDLASEEPLAEEDEVEDFSIKRLKPQTGPNFTANTQGYSNNRFGQNSSSDNRFSYPLEEKNPNKIWKILILGLVGVITIALVIFLLKNQYIPFIGKDSSVVISSPSPTPASTPEPTPTPIPELPRADFKIRILNGTTTTGLAASTSAMLKELGYQIDRVGNNSNQKIAQTVVSVKTGNQSLAEQLIRDLSSKFEASLSAAPLAQTDPADAQVVLGAK